MKKLFFALFFSITFFAQQSLNAQIKEDVSSVDNVIKAVYESISSEEGKEGDWERFRSLFTPDAQLFMLSSDAEKGAGYVEMSLADFIALSGSFSAKSGFYEYEIFRETQKFGQIAHVFSTYGCKEKQSDKEPFLRGINSFQLVNDGNRWWIVNVTWQNEKEGFEIPEKYLSN